MPTEIVTVEEHGAKSNDDIDDTAAVRQAIAAAERRSFDLGQRVAVRFGAGQYLISDVLFVGAPRVWLVGNGTTGSASTSLMITKALNEVIPLGHTTSDLSQEGRNFSWRGGMIWFTYDPQRVSATNPAIAIRGSAPQGATALTIDPAQAATAAAWVGSTIHLRYRGNAAWRNLVFGHPSAAIIDWKSWSMVEADDTVRWEYATRIQRVEGNRLILAKPLRLPIDPAWSVVIGQRSGDLSDNGVVGLNILFPIHPVMPHLQYLGYNGISFSVAHEGWIDDVVIENADNAVILERTSHTTVRKVIVSGHPIIILLLCVSNAATI